VLHPAGQLVRERLAEPGQADPVQQRGGFLLQFGVIALVQPRSSLGPGNGPPVRSTGAQAISARDSRN
jgi:hypothetical protein